MLHIIHGLETGFTDVTFNPFWDASVIEDGDYNFVINNLSIPFGMLPLIAQKNNLANMNSFNPFWDASRPFIKRLPYDFAIFQSLLGCFLKSKTSRPLAGRLSIPFGMLQVEVLWGRTSAIAFNPFWDASDRSKINVSQCDYDLSIPFGMLPEKREKELIEKAYNFQSLLGCF